MSKERTSLSLDPEVAEYLRQDHVNASGLVNSLVEKHMNGGASEDMIREFRIRQVESELNNLEEQAQRKEEELDKLKEIDEERQDEISEIIEEAQKALSRIPNPTIDNPAVKNWAEKCDMEPAELLREIDNE